MAVRYAYLIRCAHHKYTNTLCGKGESVFSFKHGYDAKLELLGMSKTPKAIPGR